MTTAEAIIQHLKSLPDSAQREVLDFVQFLESRRKELTVREEDDAWSDFSLASAMQGMEDEETPYTLADIPGHVLCGSERVWLNGSWVFPMPR